VQHFSDFFLLVKYTVCRGHMRCEILGDKKRGRVEKRSYEGS
jgi:hypothetical protein